MCWPQHSQTQTNLWEAAFLPSKSRTQVKVVVEKTADQLRKKNAFCSSFLLVDWCFVTLATFALCKKFDRTLPVNKRKNLFRSFFSSKSLTTPIFRKLELQTVYNLNTKTNDRTAVRHRNLLLSKLTTNCL